MCPRVQLLSSAIVFKYRHWWWISYPHFKFLCPIHPAITEYFNFGFIQLPFFTHLLLQTAGENVWSLINMQPEFKSLLNSLSRSSKMRPLHLHCIFQDLNHYYSCLPITHKIIQKHIGNLLIYHFSRKKNEGTVLILQQGLCSLSTFLDLSGRDFTCLREPTACKKGHPPILCDTSTIIYPFFCLWSLLFPLWTPL